MFRPSSEAIAAGKVPVGAPRMIDVLVADPDDGERWVREPLFEGPGDRVLPSGELDALMSAAGFRPYLRWADAEVLEASAERCRCGGRLEARGFLRADPRSYRTFGVCTACHLVAFEF